MRKLKLMLNANGLIKALKHTHNYVTIGKN